VEVPEDWRKLCDEELYDLFFSPDIRLITVKEDEMDGAYGKCGEEEKRIQGLDGES
jgi:hypothetical protein